MSETILVVEDEQDVLDLVVFQLHKAGYKTLVATDGAAGLQLARERLPALIVLDLMLPELEGTEVCKRLKSDLKTAPIPILILSGKGEEIDRVVGFEIGADDYMVKPFSPRELILRIKAILTRVQGKPKGLEILKAGEFMVDRSRHLATLGGELLHLTAIEFKLLATLMERQGRAQSRQQLLTDVWGYEGNTDTRTVDTHVRRLRNKLGAGAESIESIRSIGYRFSVPAKPS